jgi:hypothetical protein
MRLFVSGCLHQSFVGAGDNVRRPFQHRPIAFDAFDAGHHEISTVGGPGISPLLHLGRAVHFARLEFNDSVDFLGVIDCRVDVLHLIRVGGVVHNQKPWCLGGRRTYGSQKHGLNGNQAD